MRPTVASAPATDGTIRVGQTPAIEAVKLGRRYGRAWALVDVNLVIPRGTTVLVAGRNGSGKSTLFRVLAGALSPDLGTLKIEGCDSINDRTGLRRHVALLTHNTFAYESLTAFENMRVFAGLLGRPTDRKSIVTLLDEMGLGARADDAVHTFSAGMRKRLAFARVLLQKPSVALLDEPYAQLDPPGLRFVDALVPRLKAEGVTVLVAEHLLERGAQLCDRGLVLDRGRVTWSGAAKDLPTESGLLQAPSSTSAA
jgi:ABC-type multidrug transport system ATPase subunit